MPTATIIMLGAFAGLTIYLGLPFAFIKHIPMKAKAFLSMLATGVLLFLLYDMIGKASEPIGEAIASVRAGQGGGATFAMDVILLVLGLGLGLVGLAYFNTRVMPRCKPFAIMNAVAAGRPGTRAASCEAPRHVAEAQLALASVGSGGAATLQRASREPAAAAAVAPLTPVADLDPRTLALCIATGIGLHNFSEGLAIGQSAATGALQLAAVLIIGFGLHNMSEGFGISGPLTGQSVSWKFIALLGLIGGGPTFLGTIVGIVFHSPQLFIFCLALAAGAIIYVITELLGVAKRFRSPEIVMWGLLAGFLLGYMTDLIVTFAGA